MDDLKTPLPESGAEEEITGTEAETPAEETNEPEVAPETDQAEEPQETEEEQEARFIRMTLDSGVVPLEVRYSQINSCYRKLPVAYRSYTYVNSVVEGVIAPEKYAYAADETETGERLARFNLKAAMNAIEKMILAGRNVNFITARIPPRMVRETDFYGAIKSILDENQFRFPEKLCLEFPRSVLFEDEEKVRMAVLSMKLLKVRTMMTGCGEKDSPLTPLIHLPFDYLLISPFVTALADSRDKGTSIAALLSFLRGLPSDLVADGVYNDAQITALSRADCFGYIPSSGYHGSVQHGRLRMPLEEAIAQKEEEEF